LAGWPCGRISVAVSTRCSKRRDIVNVVACVTRVDFSNAGPSLYSQCRAWVKNDPQGLVGLSAKVRRVVRRAGPCVGV
jgi:hypothetical protein